MSSTLSLALLSLLLALFFPAVPATGEQALLSSPDPHASSSWEWMDCGSATDVVDIKSLTISPDPPQPGQNLTVKASGYVSETVEKGSWADVTVKLGLIKLLTKSFDICDEANKAKATLQCPVKPGDHEIEHTVALPKEIPPAKFVVDVRAYNADTRDMLCVSIKLDFMPSLSQQFFHR